MASFIAELKHRNVFKVGVAYAIVAWLLIQVTDIAAPALNLPEWTLTFIIYLLIIGFSLAPLWHWLMDAWEDTTKRLPSLNARYNCPTRRRLCLKLRD